MDNEMNTLMAEGGLKTDGATTDPVSGNEVPTGSTAEEVRDDIPAKLSDGEYVIPADVVKFFGVSFFEKLRAKAKAGLEEMNANGRIGGEDTEEDDEELPFSVDELQTEDDSMDAQMQDSGFAKGGAVTGNPTPADIEANRSTFNPMAYPVGFSVFGGQAPAAQTSPAVTPPAATTTKTYVNKQGQTLVISFDAQGNPITPIPAGYKPQAAKSGQNRKDDILGGKNNPSTSGGTTNTGGNGVIGGGMGRIKLEDFASEDTLIAAGLKDIEQMKRSTKIGGAVGMLGGTVGSLAGSLAGKGYQIAELRARIQLADKYGMTKAAETLRAAEAEALKDVKGSVLLDQIASGDMLANGFYKNNPTLPTGTVTPSGTVATSGGGTGVGTSGGTGGGSTGGTGTMTKGGVSYTTSGAGKAGEYSSSKATGSTAPTSSPRPVARPATAQTTAQANKQASSAVSAMKQGAKVGLAKGGLMQKKTKK